MIEVVVWILIMFRGDTGIDTRNTFKTKEKCEAARAEVYVKGG